MLRVVSFFSISFLATIVLTSCSGASYESKLPELSLYSACVNNVDNDMVELPSTPYYQSKSSKKSTCVLSNSKIESIDYDVLGAHDEIDPILKELVSDVPGHNIKNKPVKYPLIVRLDTENQERIKKMTNHASVDWPTKVVLAFDGYVVSNLVFFSPIESQEVNITLNEFQYSFIINRLE